MPPAIGTRGNITAARKNYSIDDVEQVFRVLLARGENHRQRAYRPHRIDVAVGTENASGEPSRA
jgi:hypothetical protein